MRVVRLGDVRFGGGCTLDACDCDVVVTRRYGNSIAVCFLDPTASREHSGLPGDALLLLDADTPVYRGRFIDALEDLQDE